MAALSLNEATSINPKQQFEIIDKTENKENIILICFDPNNETEDLKKRFDQTNDYVVFHTELELCITFIQSIEKQKIFLITSGSSASQLLSHITTIHPIDCIFIFCSKGDSYKHLQLENTKIIGIYDKLDLLCSSIQEQIDFAEKYIHTWCFYDQDGYATKDLSSQSSDFLWFQLFHDVILHLPRDEQTKKQMIDACHQHYRNNLEKFILLNEFEQKYEANKALHWYMKSLFLNKMITKALRKEDINQLYTLRYFLADLLENFAREHQQIIQSNRDNFIVYRQMKLSSDEFEELKENKGKLISMKGFLMAHTDRSSVLSSSTSSLEPSHFISVLFEIECNVRELGNSLIFADITQFNELSCQETVLFDFNATFQLEDMQQDEQLWVIKLNAVSDGQTIKQKYIDDTRRQINNLSIPIIFGNLICDMSQWNQSQKYFEDLFNNSHGEDFAWIEYSIGRAHHAKGEWDEARIYYDRAYDRMMQNEPVRIKDSAIALSKIGEILYLQGKYEESLDFHERALTIRKKYYDSSHAHIAFSLENIGLIYYQKQKQDEALLFLEQALAIHEEYYNHFHADIAGILNNIGYILSYRGTYDEALAYHQRAMSIYKKYHQSNHTTIANTLSYIGVVMYNQRNYDEAFDFQQRALNIREIYYPSNYGNIANTLCHMGSIRIGQENYDEAITLYQQALAIYEKYYPSYHKEIANSLMHIGYIKSNQRQFDEALRYYSRAVTIFEEFHPTNHTDIVLHLEQIGYVWYQKSVYSSAIKYFEKCLRIRETSLSSEHLLIADTLSTLSQLHRTESEYEISLIYELKSFSIREKVHPPDHQDIGKCLFDIAECYEHLNQLKLALDYYKRALIVYEQCLPYWQEDRQDVELKIKQLSEDIEKSNI